MAKMRNIYISAWEKSAEMSIFCPKNAQKVKFENFPKKIFCGIFLKDQKICLYGENEEHL